MKKIFSMIVLIFSFALLKGQDLNDLYSKYQKDPCLAIDTDIDKYTGERTFRTPFSGIYQDDEHSQTEVNYDKTISKGGVVRYYLTLQIGGNIPLATEHGVYIILKNGKKISKPNVKVETTVDEYRHDGGEPYLRRSFFALTPADLVLLRQSPITDFKLYIDDTTVNHPEQYMQLLNCLTSRK